MGIALVPESAQALNFDGVVLRTLRLSPKAFAELHLVWRRSNDNPALNRFRDLVPISFLKIARRKIGIFYVDLLDGTN